MNRYTIEHNGQRFVVEAPDEAGAIKAIEAFRPAAAPSADFVAPEPPPGAMIHGGDGVSRIAGSDVAMRRDANAITSPQKEREAAIQAQALQNRAKAGDMRALSPVMQGLSLGAGDEILSGAYGAAQAAMGGSFGDNYALAQETQRQALAQRREEAPIASAASEIVGGVGTGVGLGAAGMSLAGRGASTLGRMGFGALEGAGLGALYGFNSGSGAQDRAMGAVTGGITGAALGGALPAAADGVRAGARRVMDAFGANRQAQALGLSPTSAQILRETFEADGTLGQRGLANIRAAGPDAMVADAGPNARALLDTAVQKTGPASALARDAIDARVSRAGQRIAQALDDTLGKPEGVATARDTIRQSTAAARGNAYDKAFSTPIDYASNEGRALEGLMRRVPGNAIAKANELMRLEGVQSKQIMAQIADDGSVTFQRMPDVRQLHYIKMALDQVAREADGQGALGGQTPLGRAYEDLARALRNKLNDAVPEYGQASAIAADAIGRSKAVQFGSEMLRADVTRDEAFRQLNNMSGAERKAAAQGLRSRIDDAMARVTRTVSDGDVDAREAIKALRDLSSRDAREKVTALLGDQQAANLFQRIDEATSAFDMRAAVAQNSKTFARQNASETITSANQAGPFDLLREGRPLDASRRVVQTLFGRTPDALREKEGRIYEEIARVLVSNPGQAAPTMQAIVNMAQQSGASQASADRIARALIAANPALSIAGSSQAQRLR